MKRILLFILFPEHGFRKEVQEKKISRSKIIYCIFINAILPLFFLLFGLIINQNQQWKNIIQEKAGDTEIIEKVDDYGRYLPIAFVYGLDFTKLTARNTIIKRTGIIVLSYIISDFVVHRTKKATNIARPNPEYKGGSFPSQHSNQAFLAATILHHEYIGKSTTVSAAGYVVASGVAYLRVARDKHWSSDVLVGAAVGMITVNIIYMFLFGLLEKGICIIWQKFRQKKNK